MRKQRVAIIGCGKIANAAHAPSYSRNPGAEIAWCVDIIPERAQSLADSYGDGAAKVAEDYREMLRDGSVDAVSVCVPNYLHAPISIDCLNAGKHVLCEKPAAMNYGQALEMKAAADRSGRILNIGVVNRFNTSVNKIKQMIDGGELGKLYHIYCSFRAHRSIPGLGGQFTNKDTAGGGVLIDWGVHFIDLIYYCIGDVKLLTASGEAYSVLGRDMPDYAYTSMWAGPPDYAGKYDVEDFVTGFVRTSGPTITLNGAWAQNIGEGAMFIEFIGDRGGVKLQYGGKFTYYTAKDGALLETKYDYAMGDMFYDEIDAFLDCSVSGEKIRSNIDSVLITANTMEGIYRSAEEKREISF